MATVTITITDETEEDGKNPVTLKIESDPAFPGPAAEDQSLTPGQFLALSGWEHITSRASKGSHETD